MRTFSRSVASCVISAALAACSLSGCGSAGRNSTTVAESVVPVETESTVIQESIVSAGNDPTAAPAAETVSAPPVEAVLEETGLPEDVSSLVYSETPESLDVSLMVVGDGSASYDIDGVYSIKQYNEESCFWCEIAEIDPDVQSFGNYVLDRENRVDAEIDWQSRYGVLSPGIYRFSSSVKDQSKGKEYTYGEPFMLLADRNSGEILPAYSYPGTDPVEEAISSYFSGMNNYDMTGNSIDIISPVIFKTEERDGELLVWGTFWDNIFRKQGKVLYNTAGGENSGLLHLKKSDSGYTVSSFDRVLDGSEYDSSWKEICAGDDDVYFMLSSEPTREKLDEMTSELVKKYAAGNGLKITTLYYAGHEPVVLN